MRFSLNALKQIYQQSGLDDPTAGQPVEKVIQKLGAQLGEVEGVIDLGKKYDGAVVTKVIACEDHPNADKLKLCAIDDGGNNTGVKRDKNGFVQVVCGAPNVREGMLAAWLPPGAIVPATYDKEPLNLEAREIRGQVSNGMLASPSELGISDDHDGILEIDKKANPGDSFAKLYLLDDYIIDIENKMFTHRPDCFGLLGIAREISGIYGSPFTSPDWYVENPELPPAADELKLEVTNEIPQLVPRFCAVAMKDVKVGPSPVWLQIALTKAGIKSVNNIVDLTNFCMWYTGQPLHAYDYGKVTKLSSNGAVLKVRAAKKNEKLKLLNGKEITMAGTEIMIATDKEPIGVGGVIGGAATEVDESTKNIILECANFDSYNIRRTSMLHGIFTDAVTRFTKGQSLHQNPAVLAKAAGDMSRLTGGKPASKLFDLKTKITPNRTIKTSPGFINDRLGLKLKSDEITKLLENVEFKADKTAGLQITAPFWRTDIEIPEDIVEEVGRLYGYDRLPLQLPEKAMAPSLVGKELELKQRIRENLAALGANEVLNYSFVRGDLLEAAGQDRARSYKIKNALSPDLQYYRQALTPSLLEKVHPNIKAGIDDFALFETGVVHIKGEETDALPTELPRLALVTASKNKHAGAAFYTARKYLVDLLEKFNASEDEIVFEPFEPADKEPAAVYYQSGRAAIVKINGKIIGRIGEYNQTITAKLKLPEACAGFELGLRPLALSGDKKKYKPLSRYPAISQDLTLQVPARTAHAELLREVKKLAGTRKPDDVEATVSTIDIYQDKAEPEYKQVTLRFQLVSYRRTLTTEEASLMVESINKAVKKTS